MGQVAAPPDLIEVALADALTQAALAGAWDAVAAVAELRARREARAGVVSLDARAREARGAEP